MAFRTALAQAAGTTAERVALHCVHQHDAPHFDQDSEKLLAQQGQSGKIYGGVATTWSVSQAPFSTLYVLKNANDGFVVQVDPTDKTGTQSITGAYLWDKADFLEGAADIVQLNAGSSISYHFDWMTAVNQQNAAITTDRAAPSQSASGTGDGTPMMAKAMLAATEANAASNARE